MLQANRLINICWQCLLFFLHFDGDRRKVSEEPDVGLGANVESVQVDLKNDKAAVHKIEAPIDLVEDQFTAFYVYLLGDFFM